MVVYEKKVTKESVYDEGKGKVEFVGVETFDDFGGAGVDGVGDECAPGHDQDKLVEVVDRVVVVYATVVLCAFFKEYKFAAAFVEREEHGKEKGADDEPVGEDDVEGDSASGGADDEAHGDGEYVDNDPVFEPDRVGKGEGLIEKEDEKKLGTNTIGQCECDQSKQYDECDCNGDTECATGEGTVAFDGMRAVFLNVEQVVEEVGGAGSHAESGEGQYAAKKLCGIQELLCKE